VLLEFILDKKHEGAAAHPGADRAGAIRTRPIVLTAAAAILGSAVIVTDPVWSAWPWRSSSGCWRHGTHPGGDPALLLYA